MIKRFGSLFAGHIDLGDMGEDATPANERRYSNEELTGVFAKAEAMAIAIDSGSATMATVTSASRDSRRLDRRLSIG